MKSLAVGTTCLSGSGPGGGCSRLSVRNGRSVVHKNLEDNYGAVISANHEALAQILEQVSTTYIRGFGNSEYHWHPRLKRTIG